MGSIYTNYFVEQKVLNQQSSDFQGKSNNNNIKYPNSNSVFSVDHNTTIYNQQSEKLKKRSSIVDRFFACFCIVKNSTIITTDSLGTDSIEVIHGMR